MRKCRWSSTRHDAVVSTARSGILLLVAAVGSLKKSVLFVTVIFMWFCVSVAWVKPPQNPVPVRVPQSYFFQSARHFFKSSLTFSPSLLHSIFIFFFLHAGSFNPPWCFKAEEGDEQRNPPIRRENQVEEAGTLCHGWVCLPVSLILSTLNKGHFKLLQKDVHCCPSNRWHLFILCGERNKDRHRLPWMNAWARM